MSSPIFPPENERDTKFRQFAEFLYNELGKIDTSTIQRFGDYEPFDKRAKAIIAQFLYDHACYVASFMTVPEVQRMCAGMLSPAQAIAHIEDLPEWPS